MGFVILRIIYRIYKRFQIYLRLNRLERHKLNGIRRKRRLPPIYTFCDWIWDIVCFPFQLVFDIIYDLYERIVTSFGFRGRRRPLNGQMRRLFKNLTEENKLFRKFVYFLFGLSLSYLAFLFLYSQHILNNYLLIATTIGLTAVFALIAPFNERILCLILIGLPSMFSSKVRYVLVAYVIYALYFQLFPNIWNNGMEGIGSFGCSVWQTGRGGKKMAGLMVADIKEFIRDVKSKMRQIIRNMKEYLKSLDLGISMPSVNVKAICNEPTDEDTYKCEDKISLGSLGDNRVYPPFICTSIWSGFAGLCQETKKDMIFLYKETKREMIEAIEKLEKELYFDVDLNEDFDYHYNTSDKFGETFKRIGIKYMEKHWLLAYIPYLLSVKSFLLLIFTLWIVIISVIYRFRYLTSDPFDNTYLNEEILKIDRKRAASRKETVIPLDFQEGKHFIYTFEPNMTPIEFNRFILGIAIMGITLIQVVVYCGLDFGIYYLVYWYNTFIDVLADIFSPSAVVVEFNGNSFLANRLNRLNDGFNVKKRVVEHIQSCKSFPLAPDLYLYRRILILLVVILFTIFCSSYGLRFRHYFAGLFYPHRVPIRAVWLYNNILSRRGNIFQFFRKKMRQQVYGKEKTTEDISILDRLCAQSVVIRIICKLLGLYGQHKYCQICGLKVMVDGSDQSVRCVHNCGAIYCYDCLGEQNNICSVCMNCIDYTEFGDNSEELDSSEEDIDYHLTNQDFLYQYSDETKTGLTTSDEWDDFDPTLFQRKDLVTLAYKYDTVDRVPSVVYLDNDEAYDGEDESEEESEYQKRIFGLEQELGIPAEHILQMKQNAKYLVAEDMNGFPQKVKEEKYSQLRREDDQRIVKNSMLLINKDRKKYIRKSRFGHK